LRFLRSFFGLLAATAMLLAASESSARRYNRLVVFPPQPESLPAVHYANLEARQCLRELEKREIPFTLAPKHPAIDTPVLFAAPLHGVTFESTRSPRGIHLLDCRLLLALDTLSLIAAERGIEVVRYNSIHRRGWARRRVQGHRGGVAIDVVELVRWDGAVLNVRKDFAGDGVGSESCSEHAKPFGLGKSADLRAFLCALDRTRTFNLLLGPHYDYRHDDHFHFEVRRGVNWFLTQ
jgi:hypothetical protein